jgi:hypothetical protein
MNAIVTGMRAFVNANGQPKMAFDILFYGAPFSVDDSRMASLQIDVAAGDTANTLGGKINTAIDAEASRITAGMPGGSVTPATTLAPSYIKLR